MHEIVVNLHMHTRYSDGTGSHHDIASAALRSGLDAVVVTDHNVWIDGMQRYHEVGDKRLLVLIGEEIHDRRVLPQKNHLLVLGAGRELAPMGHDLGTLLRGVRDAGGLAFLAHPVDPEAPAFHEPDISWTAWPESGITGVELWNGFSELKGYIPTRLHGLFYALFPKMVPRGPFPKALEQWDHLLAGGRFVALGGSDAHSLRLQSGPIRRTVFPYEYHFSTVNTHVIMSGPLSGVAATDAKAILDSIASGRCFIGNDLPRSTRGFRFIAYARDGTAVMGQEAKAREGIALHARTPDFAEIILLKDGRPVQTVGFGQALTHRTVQPGVYRIQAYRRYLGRRCSWIVSNPIYLR